VQSFAEALRNELAGSFKVQAVAAKVMPDTAKAEMHRRMAEPGSASEPAN